MEFRNGITRVKLLTLILLTPSLLTLACGGGDEGGGGTNGNAGISGANSGGSTGGGAASGGVAGGGSTNGGDAGQNGPPTCASAGVISAELTDPTCDDGKYCEQLPDLTVDIGPLVSDLKKATELSEMTRLGLELLDASWSFGGAYLHAAGKECHERWANDSWGPLVGLAFALHECGHGQDFDSSYAYEPSAGYSLPVPKEDYFGRGEITADAFHSQIPDAAANDTYFVGSISEQGIQTTFSEWSQYNHDLGLMYTLQKYEPSFGHEVELALNFAWAAPRYLLWARDKHKKDYDSMMADPEVRTVILTLWGQTLLYYDALARDTDWSPGAKHTQFIEALRDPAIVGMMNDLRKAQGCKGI